MSFLQAEQTVPQVGNMVQYGPQRVKVSIAGQRPHIASGRACVCVCTRSGAACSEITEPQPHLQCSSSRRRQRRRRFLFVFSPFAVRCSSTCTSCDFCLQVSESKATQTHFTLDKTALEPLIKRIEIVQTIPKCFN